MKEDLNPMTADHLLRSRWASAVTTVTITCLLWLMGCGREESVAPSGSSSVGPASAAAAESSQQEEPLAKAERLRRAGNWEGAAKAASNALILDPDSVEARLVAARIEADRGNPAGAIELVDGVDVKTRLGRQVVDLHVAQLVKTDRISAAADVLVASIHSLPNLTPWRHQAWALLHQVGRSQEAAEQAITLCRRGEATRDELLSLVSRSSSFPSPEMLERSEASPKKYFRAGAGLARWHATQEQYRDALAELDQLEASEIGEPSVSAFWGRMLTENQANERFVRWHLSTNDRVRQFNDYWAALGTYFFDQRQYEASARALLDAVAIDPTDRTSIQRLAKVFDALGRSEDGAQFRDLGTRIAQSERTAAALYVKPSELPLYQRLTHQVMDLGRPFETLQWTSMMMPANATRQRAAVAAQRGQLLRSEDALAMAGESSQLGIDPQQFSLESSLKELADAAGEQLPDESNSVAVESLAVPRLVDVAADRGLIFQWYTDWEMSLKSIPIHESIGGGIAVLDFDCDGWPDVYCTQGSGEPPTDACTRSNLLFRNVAGQFAEVTVTAEATDHNYSSGVAAGDVNQDGFPDLYLGSLGHNRLLINNGDGTFRDATDDLGEFADRFTSSLAIADINGDGLPDLFEANYIEMDGAFKLPEMGDDGFETLPSPLFHYAESDRWFSSRGDGTFQMLEIGREVAKPGTSLGVIVTDFTGDRKNEVFVGNDVRGNHFLIQQGGDRFVNAADVKGVANGFSGAANGCMGIASGDFNRDGRIDLHITNYAEESNNLYLQAEGGGYTDYAIRYQIDSVSTPYVGFGTKAIDFDRNGWLDLIITNGHIFDMSHTGEEFRMPPQLLMSRGDHFEIASVEDPSEYWKESYLGRAMATLDFDRDGTLDALVGHLDRPTALLQNQTVTDGSWVQFELIGVDSERDAIGARVIVSCGEQSWTQWVAAGDGYFCSDQAVLDFGLGIDADIDRVDVVWPSGRRQRFQSLATGKRYRLIEGYQPTPESF